jgi:hypothetical protein
VIGATADPKAGYRAWMVAARDAAGGPTKLGKLVAEHFDRGRVRRVGVPLTRVPGATVSGWVDGRVPSERLRDALCDVVGELVTDPPPGSGNFRDELECARGGSRANERAGSEKGTATRRAEPTLRRQHILSEVLLGMWQADRLDLTQHSWRLGSWMFDGALPPYAARAADKRLSDDLTEAASTLLPERRLLVVAGPPKAGKTRSLLEAIRRTRPAAPVWWARPGPTTLRRLSDALERDDPTSARPVIVADDFQKFGLSHHGTTGADIRRLLETGATVAATIHDSVIDDLQDATLDRRDERTADADLTDLLKRRTVHIAPTLTSDELHRLPRALVSAAEQNGVHRDQLARLAESLAAVDQLIAACEAARTASDPTCWALVAAALDARVIERGDATTLDRFMHWHYRASAPTRLWTSALFNHALEWATRPVGGAGSPHSVIHPTTDGESLELLDALAFRLPHDLDVLAAHVEELDVGLCTVICENKDPTWVRLRGQPIPESILHRAHHEGSKCATDDLIHLNEQRGDWGAEVELRLQSIQRLPPSEAERSMWRGDISRAIMRAIGRDRDAERRFAETGAKMGDELAVEHSGRIALADGRLDDAERWFKQVAESSRDALCGLGDVALARGQRDVAEAHYRSAANFLYPKGWYKLGQLFASVGENDEARRWFLMAASGTARRTSSEALQELARLARLDGDTLWADRWAGELAMGDPDARYARALSARERDDSDHEMFHLAWAAKLGHTQAALDFANKLDRVPPQHLDIDIAVDALERADDLGDPAAAEWLRVLRAD